MLSMSAGTTGLLECAMMASFSEVPQGTFFEFAGDNTHEMRAWSGKSQKTRARACLVEGLRGWCPIRQARHIVSTTKVTVAAMDRVDEGD